MSSTKKHLNSLKLPMTTRRKIRVHNSQGKSEVSSVKSASFSRMTSSASRIISVSRASTANQNLLTQRSSVTESIQSESHIEINEIINEKNIPGESIVSATEEKNIPETHTVKTEQSHSSENNGSIETVEKSFESTECVENKKNLESSDKNLLVSDKSVENEAQKTESALNQTSPNTTKQLPVSKKLLSLLNAKKFKILTILMVLLVTALIALLIAQSQLKSNTSSMFLFLN